MALDKTRLLEMIHAVNSTQGQTSAEKAQELLRYVKGGGADQTETRLGAGVFSGPVWPDLGYTITTQDQQSAERAELEEQMAAAQFGSQTGESPFPPDHLLPDQLSTHQNVVFVSAVFEPQSQQWQMTPQD